MLPLNYPMNNISFYHSPIVLHISTSIQVYWYRTYLPKYLHFFHYISRSANQSENMNSNQDDVLKLYDDVIAKMVLDWRYQARVDDTVYGFLVALYACMIIVGATGNLLVIFVVIRNRAMRTARNVFIVNLAISDLMLCLITMPLTLVEILYMTWQVSNISTAGS